MSSGIFLKTWVEFETAVSNEIISLDYAKMAKNKLQKLQETNSVLIYLSKFGNTIRTLSGISDDEKMDHFVECLNQPIRVEVLKAQTDSFEANARVALSVDSAV